MHPRMCDISVQLVIPIFELMTVSAYWRRRYPVVTEECSMLFSSFFVLFIPFSHQIYAYFSSLKMSAIIETLMQCAECSQFAVDYFRISLI